MTKRDNSLDVLRGILLVMITINHIGGPLCTFTFQPMSFVSAAEGFVFLSGYILCLVYGKRLIRGQTVTLSTICKRSLKIYWYHLTVLFILLIPYFLNTPFLKQWQFNELATFIEKPREAVLAYSLLLFQPEHLDILPMYILFIPIGFLALKAFIKQKTSTILSVSFLIWFVSQFQFVNTRFENPFNLTSGFFNPFSWQILFIAGCYFGYSRSIGKEIIPKSGRILFPTLITFFTLAFIRYYKGEDITIFKLILDHSTKPNLQFFRLLNVFVIAYIIDYAIRFKYFPQIKSLAFLGRHSLQVFVFQVLLVYFYEPFRPEVFNLGYVGRIGIQVIGAITLFLPAFMHYYYKNAARKKLVVSDINNVAEELFQTQNNGMMEINRK